MKKYVILLFLLAGCAAWAQDVVRDSAAVKGNNDTVEENVVDVTSSNRTLRKHKEANVLGAPVYYDNNGNVIGSANPSPVYHRPKHHYLNNLDNRYCSFFAEGEWLNGKNDMELAEIAQSGIGLYFLFMPFMGINAVLSVFFTSCEKPLPSQPRRRRVSLPCALRC